MKKSFMHLFGKIRYRSQAIAKSPVKTIYERKDFIDLIELERERVHREENQFSLILISVDGNNNKNGHVIELVYEISKRVRRIDRIGWYDNTHIGVLLPNTTYTGAQIVARDICKYQGRSSNPISLKTLSYPEQSESSCAIDSDTPL
jgi:PleD family two-component response regulator